MSLCIFFHRLECVALVWADPADVAVCLSFPFIIVIIVSPGDSCIWIDHKPARTCSAIKRILVKITVSERHKCSALKKSAACDPNNTVESIQNNIYTVIGFVRQRFFHQDRQSGEITNASVPWDIDASHSHPHQGLHHRPCSCACWMSTWCPEEGEVVDTANCWADFLAS